MSNYTYVMGENSVTLFNLLNGNKVTIFEDDARYAKFKDLILVGDYEEAERQDVKMVVQSFAEYSSSRNFNVVVNDGVGTVQFSGQEYPLEEAITKRIVKMHGEGFDATPLINFLENLYNNPSKTAVDELFLFLDATELPITQDGHFIAYKVVSKDYLDIYTGKISNKIGDTVEMPRFAVDDKRNNTCSSGLHFCSKDYLAHYGSTKQETDRCVLVKINPADVVSIPSDYNNAKGRTCKYVVVGEMNDSDWRKVLSERDYNQRCVVDDYGDDFEYPEYDSDEDEDQSSRDYYNDAANWQDDCDFEFDTKMKCWRYRETGMIVSLQNLINVMGWTLAHVVDLEDQAYRQ